MLVRAIFLATSAFSLTEKHCRDYAILPAYIPRACNLPQKLKINEEWLCRKSSSKSWTYFNFCIFRVRAVVQKCEEVANKQSKENNSAQPWTASPSEV